MDSVLSTFYGPQASGGMLASYAGLAAENKQHPFVENALTRLFDEFISRHLIPLREGGYEHAAIIGSVGYGFSEILHVLLQKAGFSEIRFLKDPLEDLPELLWNQNQ